MLMDKETIVTLYREAIDNGDPKEIIKSMAKTNGCTPGEIRQILNDAGEFVPRQKRGRPKAAVINQDFEDAVNNMIEESRREGKMSDTEAAGDRAAAGHEPERQLPLPDAVKRCIMKGLDDIEAEIRRKQEELATLEAEYNTISEYIKN